MGTKTRRILNFFFFWIENIFKKERERRGKGERRGQTDRYLQVRNSCQQNLEVAPISPLWGENQDAHSNMTPQTLVLYFEPAGQNLWALSCVFTYNLGGGGECFFFFKFQTGGSWVCCSLVAHVAVNIASKHVPHNWGIGVLEEGGESHECP